VAENQRQLGLGLGPSPAAGDRSNDGTRVNVLYIDGAARSGSTILARMVGAQPRFMTVGEAVLLWRFGVVSNGQCSCGQQFSACPFWQEVGDNAPGLFGKRAAQRYADFTTQAVLMSRTTPRLWTRRGRRELATSVPSGYLDDIARLYHTVRAVSGADVIVDASKFAAYRFLLGLVEDLTVTPVHLTRDPRAVAFSWQRKVAGNGSSQSDESLRFPERSVIVAGLDWMLQNHTTDVVSRLDGYGAYRLRYEDFAAYPTRTIRELAVLGYPSEDQRPQSQDAEIELPVDHVFGNPSRFRVGRVPIQLDDAWRHEMARTSRALVTVVAAPLIVRYGYSLRTNPPS